MDQKQKDGIKLQNSDPDLIYERTNFWDAQIRVLVQPKDKLCVTTESRPRFRCYLLSTI